MLAERGHRTVVVTATRGEWNTPPPQLKLQPGETVGQRREAELRHACKALNVKRLDFLGYVDSAFQPQTSRTFSTSSIEEAARAVARVLREETAEILITYDPGGGYAHPDHVHLSRVGSRAADLAATPIVYEVTWNRERWRAVARAAAELGIELPGADLTRIGLPPANITHEVDVVPWLEAKRSALTAHRSQVGGIGRFFALPDDLFQSLFGTESFRLVRCQNNRLQICARGDPPEPH